MSSLLQFKVDDEVKQSLEEVFAADGMSAAQGMKVVAYQIARSGRSPFISRYSNYPNEITRRAIAETRAYENGTVKDNRKRYESAEAMARDILGEDFL